jgi:DNA polymerase elongation subunit (family B)
MNLGRPRTIKDSQQITFHLREICSVVLKKYDYSVWLFGNTKDKESVAIRVDGFRPYFYIDCPDDLGDVDFWLSMINDDLRIWDDGPDMITRADRVDRVAMVGYVDNESSKYLKIEYLNCSYLWRLKKLFSNNVHVGDRPRILRMYHEDWGVESLFLHETQLRLQQWVTVSDASMVTVRLTSCQIEKTASFKSFCLTEAPIPIPPILCCSLRMRARCDLSAKTIPSADRAKDKIVGISLEIFWMGDKDNKWEYYLDDDNERSMLTTFENLVNKVFDIDCFEYLSDNCNPLQYIFIRSGEKLLLSKFKTCQSKLIRKGGKIYGFNHAGRSRMDIKCALQKLVIEPKLDGFSLKDAIFHGGVVRDQPDEKMKDYFFLGVSLLDKSVIEMQCKEELYWLRKVSQNNSMLLGFVEISSASCTQLTVSIENGQQIRVWKKLISKIHEHDLIVNKYQLEESPLIVKKKVSESSFPDPPYVANVPLSNIQNVVQRLSKDLTGKIIEPTSKKSKKSKKKYQGGYVCAPESGFYAGDDQSVFTFDFGSLYPSIIRGNNVCYMRLLYDEKYLHDDRYVKTYVCVDEERQDCIVMIDGKLDKDGNFEPSRTILPMVCNEVCRERNAVKALMAKATDPFVIEMYNSKQLGCKIFANAAYGFLGAGQNSFLACPVLMAMVCRIGQNMIKRVRYMMLKDHGAYVVYGDTDSVMVQLPHPPRLKEKKEILDYYYETCNKLAALGTSLFPSPNKLEFESMKQPLLLRMKKNYAAFEYPSFSWNVDPKLSIKGLSFKKRDRCGLVRRIGHQIMVFIMTRQDQLIIPYLEKEITHFVQNKISYDELIITCEMKHESDYKVENLIHVETAKKISKRTGLSFQPGTRLSYVVIQNKNKIYQRGEDPKYAKDNNLKIDFLHYLDKQLVSAIEPLFAFHQHINVEFNVLIQKVRQDLHRASVGVMSLSSMVKKRKLPNLTI